MILGDDYCLLCFKFDRVACNIKPYSLKDGKNIFSN